MGLLAFLTWRNAMYGAAVLAAWAVWTAAYRLYFHPLRNVPGPRLAAVTRLYLLYYNAVKNGVLYLEIERLHKVYGPIIRIAPNEVHLSDPENYDKIYSVGSKYDKDPVFYSALGADNMFAVSSNVLHRQLRAPLNPFFSRRAILDVEDLIHDKVESLCRAIDRCSEQGLPINLHDAYRALAIDIATEYAFDDCWDHLESPTFGRWFSDMIKNTGRGFWVLQQFAYLRAAVMALPDWLARRMSPDIADMLDIKLKAKRHVQEVQDNINTGAKPRRRTIFHDLLDPQAMPAGSKPRKVDDVTGEAFSICVAASDTSGNALTTATYHLIQNPTLYKQLRDELRENFPDPNERLPFAQLEKLPFLTGVVKETQRLSYGIVSRMPRLVPSEGETFNGHFIPGGTVIAMSAYLMHRNPVAFPDPDVFDPSRWIDQPADVVRAREKCYAPFGRGSRNCIGQNLAMCELYVTFGTLFRRYEEFETQDIGPLVYVDYFNAAHPDDAQPLTDVRAKRATS